MSDFEAELLAAFEAETSEHIAVVRRALARAAAGQTVDLADIFRRAHSLKGAARAVDMAPVEDLAHRLEAVLQRVVDGVLVLDEPVRRAVERALDAVEGHLSARGAGGAPEALAAAAVDLEALRPSAAGASPAAPAPPTAPAPAPAADREPEPAPAAPARAEAAAPADEAAEVLRVSVRRVEALAASLAALLGESEARAGLSEEIRTAAAEARALARGLESLSRPVAGLVAAAEAGSGGRLPPAARRLGQDVRDAERAAARLAAGLSRILQSEARRGFALERAVGRLSADVAGVSLVPVETVLGGLGRMVRDIARTQGVAVDFRTEGFDTPVDRGLLQALKDPVLHLVRNAIGHGAEPAGARTAAGKPEALAIVVEAVVAGGQFTLTVTDDGRGPDLARIETVAVERGLLDPRPAGAPPPAADRLLGLVFEAGFSTAAAVDRLSGRGLGLSVVAEAVRRRRGAVSLAAADPHGTRATLSVPLQVAVQPVLLLTSGGRTYGIPGHGVERLLRLSAEALRTVDGRPAAWIEFDGRDVVVPVVTLPEILGLPAVPLPLSAGTLTVATIRRGDRRLGLAVETLEDARPMVVAAVDGFGADPRLVVGAVLAAGDRPAPVLDAGALVDRWAESGRSPGLGFADWRPAEASRVTTILVVDDSITTRTLEKSILEAQGYRVVLAVDGLEALRLLSSGDAVVDLVIADVEMPRMDGFGLLQAIRADSRFRTLPVVMMTSRAAPEDVRRGLDLGASAYVTKQTFDQRDLLATIGQLL